MFYAVSFELYGQLHQVTAEDPADRQAFFADSVRHWVQLIDLL